MTEDIMNQIENEMVTGLQYEESYPEREEPEFDKSEADDPTLTQTLINIARLSDQNDILDNLYTGLCEGMYRKLQG